MNEMIPHLSLKPIGLTKAEIDASKEITEYSPEMSLDEKCKIASGMPFAMVQTKVKTVTVGKKQFDICPYELITMIRRVTAMIGQYNDNDQEPYAAYMVYGLRKIRTDMVSALTANFNIHFELVDGQSIFYIG